ncbi:hypothetical protein OG21DRAFT_1420211 [Imleria badia]|nr:hypothetical protein OG21DRAFT_1420211 [Imleria badia]
MFDVTSANSTGAGSSETSTNLLNDRINLIAATTLLGVTYGIVTTLYCMTTYSLLKKLFRRNTRSGSHSNSLSRSRTEWRKTLFYLTYTSILFVLATLYAAGNSQNAIVAYVDNRLYPGGPYQYYIMFMAGQGVMVMTDVTSLVILWMTDALILCRFIVFYYKVTYARWIIPLPCAMYVGVIGNTLVLQGEAGLGKIFYLSENMLLAYYALSFSLNVLSTVLIAARLYWHKVQLERVFGEHHRPRMESPYMSIATMLIESAALYGAWSLVFLILCIQRSPGQTIILATMSQVQVIAPLLIILWIARGKAWNGGKTYGEDEDEPDQRHSSGVVRLSFGSRPSRAVGEFAEDVHPNTSRNASWSTVVGGSGAGHRDGDGDVNVVELGLCGSEPPSVIADLKK